jgi:hypothetical protein
MGLFEKLFRRSRPASPADAQPSPETAEPSTPDGAETVAPVDAGPSPTDLIRTRSPGADPLADVIEILRLWQGSAPVPPDASRGHAFMGSFAREWRTRTASGSAAEVRDWFERCARKDAAGDARPACIVRGLEAVSYHWGQVAFEGIPEGWHRFGVVGSALELGVGGAYHVIAKVSEREFLHVAHG